MARSEDDVIGNCKDCKNWKASTIYPAYTIHVCDAVHFVDINEDVIEDNFAISADAEDDAMWTSLKTGPNFGCVMFKSNQ